MLSDRQLNIQILFISENNSILCQCCNKVQDRWLHIAEYRDDSKKKLSLFNPVPAMRRRKDLALWFAKYDQIR